MLKIADFWDVTSRSLVESEQLVEVICCLDLQDNED
jgi:hypothetical protein